MLALAACSGGTGTSMPGSGGSGGNTGISGSAGTGAAAGIGGNAGNLGSAGSGPAPIAGAALFFSDLTSGPNQGGQNGKGAFVTVWGNGFGDTQGTSTVTIGGGAADNYPIWTATRVTFQLGGAAASGTIVVHVAGKGDSGELPFTVRAGNIYFVTASGSDAAAGSFAAPWKTIPKAKNPIAAGDIAYLGVSAGDAVADQRDDGGLPVRSASANTAGTRAPPARRAPVAYRATARSRRVGPRRGIWPGDAGPLPDQLVVSGRRSTGGRRGWRVVGNDIPARTAPA